MNNNRIFILTPWLLILLACSWVLLSQVKLITHIAQFMPVAQTPVQTLLIEQLNSGRATRIILMAVEGNDKEALVNFSNQFTHQLRQSAFFTRVENGAQAAPDMDTTVPFQYRYLLSETTEHQPFSVTALNNSFKSRLQELSSPLSIFNKKRLPHDPTDAMGDINRKLAKQDNTTRHRGVWFSPQHNRALLIGETHTGGYDLEAQKEVLTFIQHSFTQLNTDNNFQLKLSGPSVFATESQKRIKQEVSLLSLLASFAVITILWFAYRSIPILFINALPLLTGIIVATTALQLIFGYIHGITLAFGVTILGVAIDYPIHVVSHLSGKHTVQHDIQRIWPTLRLGVITTAAGYMAMTATNFTGLAQLGIFAIIGLITAATTTRWVLPALLPRNFKVRKPRQIKRLEVFLQPDSKWLIVCILIGIAALIIIAKQAQNVFENDLSALSPIPKQQIDLDRQLRADLGAADAANLIIISDDDQESVLQTSERLKPILQELVKQGAITNYELPSDFLPSQKIQRQRQLAIPQQKHLQNNLYNALHGLPFEASQFQAFVEDAANSKQLPTISIKQLYGSGLGLKVSSLLFKSDQSWNALVTLFGVQNSQAIESRLQKLNLADVHFINFKSATNNLIADFRHETLERMQWASLFILLVLAIGVKSWRRLVLALTPVILAITADVALLLLMGDALSVFNLVALLLVFGIGIDYGLFFSRPDHEISMRMRTLHALLVCAISTITVFGILSLSQVPVLADIGKTVWMGVFMSFVFSLLIAQQVAKKVP